MGITHVMQGNMVFIRCIQGESKEDPHRPAVLPEENWPEIAYKGDGYLEQSV